jgi:hypothetical protein
MPAAKSTPEKVPVQDIYKPSSSHAERAGSTLNRRQVFDSCSATVWDFGHSTVLDTVFPLKTVPGINDRPVSLGRRFVGNADQACFEQSSESGISITSPRPRPITKAKLLSRGDVLDSADGVTPIYHLFETFVPVSSELGLRLQFSTRLVHCGKR